MTTHAEALAALRQARAARDAGRDALYALELQREMLGRARRSTARGEEARDPAAAATLRRLRTEHAAAHERRAALARQLEALASLPAEIERAQARARGAREESAALVREAKARAEELAGERTHEAARERTRDALRAAQAGRAAAERRADEARAAAIALEARLAGREALREEAAALDARLRALDGELADAGAPRDDAALPGAARENAAAIAVERQRLRGHEAEVRRALEVLFGDHTPQELIEEWDDGLPILLLPVRVETRWQLDAEAPATPELRVRVYPDDIAVTNHERTLTDAEVTHGRAYWSATRAAATSPSTAAMPDDAARAEARDAAWRVLAERLGANRAAWVALQTRPANWDVAATDAAVALAFPDPPLTKPDAWTVAPHSRVLPDRWVLLAWRGETLRISEVGAPIDDVVVLGPAPLDEDDGDASMTRDVADGTLALGDAFAWVRDFDRAVAAGMAFRVPVTAEDVAAGFDRLLVLGLKLSADADDGRALVTDLLDGHHYARPGLELLQQGTPTNNTEGSDAGWSRSDRGAGETTVAASAPARFTPVADRSVARDGQRLADFLGIGYEALQHADGASHADHAEAVAMNRALYAGTLGYYLDHMLDEVIDESALGALRRHFTDHVTGRGPVAAIRVGSQPYGILPTSALGRWTPTASRTLGAHVAVFEPQVDPFEVTLLRVLRHFDAQWGLLLPGLQHVGGAGEGAANLLGVLGLHPTSAEFFQRVGYSWDYLQNLEAFTWGGRELDDVVRMLMEEMGARALLGQLGYVRQPPEREQPKPNPLLLQLIWRHYQTRLDPAQLIDGLPLSERALVKPYDAAGTRTYLDWLAANAADPDALERQDFGAGIARPGALLYLMLHFSLVMEAGRGIHHWLADRGVQAGELLRSRKFMNVGAQASPSMWEVFRAPAHQLVDGEASAMPLLTLLHAPQLGDDAGRGVREQREALDVLRTLPTARLERALVEHVDTLGYRLDAWETSLFTRRLHRQRRMDAPVADRRMGVYLGAFGYLERVRPSTATRERVSERTLPEPLRTGGDDLHVAGTNGGYVHAPSMNHATAAALLRNGYLTHATPADPDALAVNLTSTRVRRARYLLDGVRNGQSIEALLGVQFERGLHDWTTRTPDPVILDDLKPAFRAAFPIQRTRIPQAGDSANGASLVSEDHQVVNGLAVARIATPYPYGIADLVGLSDAQRDAIVAEQAAVRDTLDALRDVLTAEAAYQLALGNFDRAAAVVQSIGNATTVPEVEVLATPRGTSLAFTQRVAVQLTTGVVDAPWAPIALTPRAQLEPSLNAWLGDLLGAPADVRCVATALAEDGTVMTDGAGPIRSVVSLADLALQPVDFVYLVRSQAEESGEAELEARVRTRFATVRALADDVVVRIAFADAGGDPAARSFAEVMPLADRLRRLLGTARTLDARHFQGASKDDPAPRDNPGRIDHAELLQRVGTRLAAVRALVPPLQAAVVAARANGGAAEAAALRGALRALADAGVTYALPRSAVGAGPQQVGALLAQADALLVRAAAMGPATDAQLAQADAATLAGRKLELLTEAVRAWMGADVLLLPRFAFHDPVAVAKAHVARDALLVYVRDTLHVPLPVEEWLHGAACVRPLVHDLEMVRAMADAVRDEPLAFAPIQLPFRAGDHWLGAQYPPTMEVVHDTISIVQHLPQGFVPADAQCGLLVDDWTETVPSREEVTGLAFNYDAPNSAPPQALLLAVTPNETGRWEWDDLVASVLDTFRRARLRAVEPDQLGALAGIGTLLPAVVAEFGTSRASVSLDYSFVIAEVSASAMAMMQVASPAPEA